MAPAPMRQPMGQEKRLELALAARAALDELQAGRGQQDHLEALAVASNVSMILCEWGIGAEYLPDVLAAQGMILAAQRRANAGQALEVTREELDTMVTLLELHEQHLEVATHLKILEAIAESHNRIVRGQKIEVRAVPHG